MEFDIKNMNLLGIIALVGSLLMIIGVFCCWVNITGTGGDTYSGMEVFNKSAEWMKSSSGTGYSYSGIHYSFVPLVALICGIISLALMIVPTVMNVDKYQNINNILGIVATVLALVAIIFGILFVTQSITTENIVTGKNTVKLFHDNRKIGFGYWFVLIGAIITFVGGAMPVVKNKVIPMISKQ